MKHTIAMLLLTGGVVSLLAAHAAGDGTGAGATANTLTDKETSEGWRLLFDGRSTAGWRGFRKANIPAGWQVVDGALTRVAEAGDIVTVEQFGSFELAFDWNIAPGGNSGVFFRVTEDAEAVWHSGPEFQILDNKAHRDGLTPETSSGADYALYAPTHDATRPPGSWNETRIVVKGNHVEYWVNGAKVVEYELGSADWTARVAKSKFGKYPKFGLAQRGHIALQDHGDRIAFRNIKIRTP